MRKIILLGWLVLSLAGGGQLHAQSFEVQELVLDLQKLGQEKQMLKDLYTGYTILSKGYGAIRDISKGSFDLHKAFLDGLLLVNPVVKNYRRVAEIVRLQEQIVGEYSSAWALFRADPHFTPDEVLFIGNVYGGLFSQTIKNLGDLANVLTDGTYRASDAERLEQIDGLYRQMAGSQAFITNFNNGTALLSLQRSADINEYEAVRQWYGLNS